MESPNDLGQLDFPRKGIAPDPVLLQAQTLGILGTRQESLWVGRAGSLGQGLEGKNHVNVRGGPAEPTSIWLPMVSSPILPGEACNLIPGAGNEATAGAAEQCKGGKSPEGLVGIKVTSFTPSVGNATSAQLGILTALSKWVPVANLAGGGGG